jgi:hypothetical protein
MHRAHRSFLPGLVILLFLLELVAPQAGAQGETCPEGLVYYEADDICLLPEDVPAGEEPVDVEDVTDEPVDDATDDGSEDALVEDEEMTDDSMEVEDPAVEEPGTIRNLTLITFSCPINWNPATRDIEASREMCTEPAVPDMTYTVLYEGVEQTTAPFRTDVDVAAAGIPLDTGMWTIQEPPREGLDDPFAYCAIYAADGSSRLTVMETVPGGSLDILLAAGEEVNCEWYSVATVPEVTGDPNALPIGGLKLDGFSCPYGTDNSATVEYLATTCIEKGVAVVEYVASLDGAVVSTQAGATDTPGVDFQKGLDTRLLSGTWTVSANLPPEYDESGIFCSITTEAGVKTDLEPETLFGSIDLDLQPGDTGFCLWFSVESEPRTGPSLGISLLLHTCPEDFDPESGDYQTCTLPLQEPISFDFIRSGQLVETGTASAPDTTLAVTGNPEAGEWTIRPTVPSNRLEPGWACWGVDSAGARVLGIDYFSPTDNGVGISAKFGPNLMLQCDVWIYSNDLADYVQVTAATCPDGFDAANPAAGDRNASCNRERFIGFTYTVDDVPVSEGETGSNGFAMTPKQPGQWRITAVPEEGQGVTFVTCDQTHAALGQVQTIEPTINADNVSVTLDLKEGDSLRCDFFIGLMATTGDDTAASEGSPEADPDTMEPAMEPETGTGETEGETEPSDTPSGGSPFGGGSDGATDESGTAAEPSDATNGSGTADEPATAGASSLSIQHWDCPVSISAEATADDLIESCTASLEPSSWLLNEEPLDAGDGYAVWEGLEPGTVTVSNLAAVDKDESASAVYCSISLTDDGEPLFGVEASVQDGAIGLVLDQPTIVYCNWFVAP